MIVKCDRAEKTKQIFLVVMQNYGNFAGEKNQIAIV
jgi:hypothetical protein